MSDSESPSRREALHRVGLGVAAAPALLAAGTVAAQSSASGPAVPTTRPSGVHDPREGYPKPPFPAQ